MICACGECGLEAQPSKKYVHGHNRKFKKGVENPNYGRECPNELKEKLSKLFKGKKRPSLSGEKHPFYGKRRLGIAKKGKDSPNYGLKRSEETIAKLKAKTCSLETRKKISDSKKGNLYNLWKKRLEQARENLSEAHKGIIPSVENFIKRSKSLKRAYLEGRMSAKTTPSINGIFKEIRFCSSCELRFLMEFSNLVSIVRADDYGRKFRISYFLSDGSEHTYTPDFLMVLKTFFMKSNLRRKFKLKKIWLRKKLLLSFVKVLVGLIK